MATKRPKDKIGGIDVIVGKRDDIDPSTVKNPNMDRLLKSQKKLGTNVAKSIQKQSLNTVVLNPDYEEEKVRIGHRSVRGKTKSVNNVLFLFDSRGIAEVPKLVTRERDALLRQPGYYDPDLVVEEPVVHERFMPPAPVIHPTIAEKKKKKLGRPKIDLDGKKKVRFK